MSASASDVDDGLARFRYSFSDGAEYHLNMFPLRVDYMRRLMREVGFQSIETYGDFQQTHRAKDPDFLIHLAGKRYVSNERAAASDQRAREAATGGTGGRSNGT